jgi:alkaline phosphatase D
MLKNKKSPSALLFVVALLVYGFLPSVCASEPASNTVLQKIAFGSCASQNKAQPIWDMVIAEKPDLFLFIGDNIYGDTEDMSVMKNKYSQLMAKPGYQKLLKTCPLLSTWDDHDYGKNDGGSEYGMRKESEKVFLDFFNVPKDSPRRSRAGVYGAQIFGKAGQRVQVIMLDTRYFRSSPLVKNKMSGKEKMRKTS